MRPGEEIPSKSFPAFTTDQLREFAAAAQDSNPIHLDEKFAKEAGFPSVIVHGMLSMSLLGNYLEEKFPNSQWKTTKFSSRFKKVTFPGDIPTCKAIVAAFENGTLTLDVCVQNQKGDVTVDGTAELRKV